MKKRRHLTLIEMLVSLGLLAILLTTLFFWYGNIKRKSCEMSVAKATLIEERYTHDILEKIVPRATLLSKNDEKITVFYSDTWPSLVFSFDRGPSADPRLANEVFARLYLEEKTHRLCLGIWPLPHLGNEAPTEPHEKMVLLDKVTSLQFDFYYPPKHETLEVDIQDIGEAHPLEGWQKMWSQDYDCLPALVKIEVTRKANAYFDQRPVSYFFELPRSGHTLIHFPSELTPKARNH